MLVCPSVTLRASQDGPPPTREDGAKRLQELEDRFHALAEEAKFRDAMAVVEEWLALLEQAHGPDAPELFGPMMYLGSMQRELADLRGAERTFLNALAIAERHPEAHLDYPIPINNLGVLYARMGAYRKAIPMYERALELRIRLYGPENGSTAQTLTNYGILLKDIGDFTKAEAFLRRSLEIQSSIYGEKHQNVGNATGILAQICINRGEYAMAESLAQKAYKIHSDINPNSLLTTVSLENLALLYLHTGALRKAEPLFDQALRNRESIYGSDHPELCRTLNNLASLYRMLGQTARARPLVERTHSIYERTFGAESPRVAESLRRLAELELQDGQFAQALVLQERSLAIHEREPGPDSPDTAEDLAQLGNLYLAQRDLPKALAHTARALAIRERVLGQDHPATANSRSDWARLLWIQGNIDDAIATQAKANDSRERELTRNLTIGSERRKLEYMALTETELDKTISLHQSGAPGNAAAARAALEIILRRKGRALDALSRQLEALQKRATPEDRALLSELTLVRAEFARKTLAGPATHNGAEYKREIAELEQQIDLLETRAAERGAELRAGALPVTLDAVREGIPAGSALVEIASYRPFDVKTRQFGPRRYTAYACGASGQIRWADLGPVEDVDALVKQLRGGLRSATAERAVKRVARQLDQRIFRPIRALVDPRTGRLLIAPDGALNLLPFAALVDERGRYLVERYDIVYLTSGRDLMRLREAGARSEGNAPEVIANPDFGATAGSAALRFVPLPGTEAEARAIASMLPEAAVMTGAQATESALKRTRSPSILHIATHGFFLSDEPRGGPDAAAREQWEATREIAQSGVPGSVLSESRDPLLRSGLGFAGANESRSETGDDGLLTALEAASLDLWGTRLVVLSACDTGVGEIRTGNGVYGLRRALTLAGAEAQLSSLWAVSDIATKDLMVAYYRELLAGRGRSEALRQTQLAMLKDPKLRHPFFWAGFIPIGAWWPLDEAKR